MLPSYHLQSCAETLAAPVQHFQMQVQVPGRGAGTPAAAFWAAPQRKARLEGQQECQRARARRDQRLGVAGALRRALGCWRPAVMPLRASWLLARWPVGLLIPELQLGSLQGTCETGASGVAALRSACAGSSAGWLERRCGTVQQTRAWARRCQRMGGFQEVPRAAASKPDLPVCLPV
jgi:hypothetical protein